MIQSARNLGSRLAGPIARLAVRSSHAVADALVPPVCLACHDPISAPDMLCGSCWASVNFIRAPLCDRLGIPLAFDTGERAVSAAAIAAPPVYNRARAVAQYDGVMRTMIQSLKYADHHNGLGLFARWLADAGRDIIGDADITVPVPLSRTRLWQRRFNQSALLGKALRRETGLTTDPMALIRTRRTRSQVGLSHDQRRRNVAGAFRVPSRRRAKVEGRCVLLLDDVITTGATIDACARALHKAGAERVDVLTLARVVDTAVSP